MTDKPASTLKSASPEFFADVNRFIDLANGVEKRLDSHHAQLAFMQAYSRYAAYHYCRTATVDNAVQRQAFADYVSKGVVALVTDHLNQMARPLPGADNTKDRPA
jgi:hypothetical protein